MENKPLAIKNPDSTCCKCLKETKINKIEIHSMGWGSGFDGRGTQINLCDDCLKETNPEWWKLEVIKGETDWDGIFYEYEDEIFEFVSTLPLEGQELFWNRYSNGWNASIIWDAQDWIDYQLKILPHEKCKEYCCYSHQEIEAYKTRFPICQHPVNVIYNDGSKGCRCPFGAIGNYGQKCDINISDECYECKHFKERTTPIKDILNEAYDDYVIYYKAKLNQEEYKNKFEI